MKKYVDPKVEVVELSAEDILTSSPGTETPSYDETDGTWDITVKP